MIAKDQAMPEEIRLWMRQHSWGDHHLKWHYNRWWDRFSPVQQQELQRQGFRRAARQEGDPGNGVDFLAMHRVMMQMLIKKFPEHAEYFDGWETPPTDPDSPLDYVPHRRGGSGRAFPERFKTAVDNIENKPELFPDDDAFGLYVQTSQNQSLTGAGIHNWLHGRWAGISPELDLGNPEVNMENQRFWRLHGWIDRQWTRFRNAKRLPDDQPEYVKALEDARMMMQHHGEHEEHEMLHLEPLRRLGARAELVSSFGELNTVFKELAPAAIANTPSARKALWELGSRSRAERLAAARLIEFDHAEIVSGIVNDTYFLIVSGYKPYANMEAKLTPAIYIDRPEWWDIAVVGHLDGVGLPVVTRYSVTLPLAGVTGKQGIRVVAKTSTETLLVP